MLDQQTRGKRAGKKVKTLRAKSLSPKQTKSVKGGYEGATISNYSFQNAWPKK